jgi:hypothetical protein
MLLARTNEVIALTCSYKVFGRRRDERRVPFAVAAAFAQGRRLFTMGQSKLLLATVFIFRGR